MWHSIFSTPERRPTALAILYLVLVVALFAASSLLSTLSCTSQTTAQALNVEQSQPTVFPSESPTMADVASSETIPGTPSARSPRNPLATTPTASPTTLPSATPVPAASPAPSPIPEQPQLPGISGKRVGLQAGHWQCANLPAEFASLRTSTGGTGGGYKEVDLNVKIAQQVAAILQQNGLVVDILPATVPIKYQADAFVAIHADANNNSAPRGFKLARSARSAIPAKDDALVASLYAEYGQATGLPRSSAITTDMTYYYSFYSSAQHTIASTTPSAIMEMGYLTNPTDRALMVDDSDVVANGIARGIISFLDSQK